MSDEEEAKTYLSLYVGEDLKTKLQTAADNDGRSLSNLATRILEAWLREKGEAQ